MNNLIVACVDGTLGQDCRQSCSNNCYNNTCHVVSGLCFSGCRKGWMGPYCKQRKLLMSYCKEDALSISFNVDGGKYNGTWQYCCVV
jgi:hypothetical protein